MAQQSKEAKALDMNQHAQALFSAAPPPLNDVLPEICVSTGLQPWQLIIGHLLKADERAELHAPLRMDEWTETSPVAPDVTQGRKCQSCHRTLVRKPNAAFCCNYCGSGRYQRDQQHHPNCEFFVAPQRHLILPTRKPALLPTPPEDPQERVQFEEAAFQQHLQEAVAAENAPGGLPPMPDEVADPREAWVGKKR